MNKQDFENKRNEFLKEIKQAPPKVNLPYTEKLVELVELAFDYNIKIKYQWNEPHQQWQVKIFNNMDKRKILCRACLCASISNKVNWLYAFEGNNYQEQGTALDIIDECFKIYRRKEVSYNE